MSPITVTAGVDIIICTITYIVRLEKKNIISYQTAVNLSFYIYE